MSPELSIDEASHPFGSAEQGHAYGLADEIFEHRARNLVGPRQGHPPDLATRSEQGVVWIVHEDAVLEAKVDVLDLRPDEPEVRRSPPDRHAVAD